MTVNRMFKTRFSGVSRPRPLFQARRAHAYNAPPTKGTSRVDQELLVPL